MNVWKAVQTPKTKGAIYNHEIRDTKYVYGIRYKKILAIEKELPGVSAADFNERLKQAESLKGWQFHQADYIRELYFRLVRNEAVLVLECKTIEHASELLAQLPLVQEKLTAFELIPLKPYPGFERLFDVNKFRASLLRGSAGD